MAKVQVKFMAEMSQTIDWPDDEMEDFNYENLQCNCDPENASVVNYAFDIEQVTVDGKPHEF